MAEVPHDEAEMVVMVAAVVAVATAAAGKEVAVQDRAATALATTMGVLSARSS